MPEADRQRWNARFQQEGYDFAPAAWLREMESTLRDHAIGARALDVACGGGRNALYLAEVGYAVDAWDISDVAIDGLSGELARRASAGQPLGVAPRRVDLERSPLPTEAYDLILDTLYLDRALFALMPLALRPGGRLLLRTFLAVPGGPQTSRLTNPAHALQAGELCAAFADSLETVDLHEDTATETAHLLARRAL